MRYYMVAFLLVFSLSAPQAQASGASIDGISVRICLEGTGYALAPQIEKRMQASVFTIADNVLSGRRIAEVQEKKQEYERLIQEVFDRILLGYTVVSAELSVGAQTQIEIRITPWQDTIQEVRLSFSFDQMPQEVQQLAAEDIKGVQTIFDQVLLGLPIDAAAWTDGILKTVLQEFLAVHLPEFRGDFEIAPGEKTEIKLFFYPKGTLIRDVDLSLRSESLPNVALINYRPSIQKKAQMLLGVPEAFVQRHAAYFTQWFTTQLAQDQLLQKIGVKTQLRLEAGAKTEISIQADTDKYLIFAEGYLDIGRDADNTSFKLHGGKYISPVDEIFLEVDFYPQTVKWVFMPGMSRKVTPRLTLGFKYDLNDSKNILWARQRLSDRWLLRAEHTPQANFNEFAVRYMLHDFVGVEYVINDEEHWLRMVGKF